MVIFIISAVLGYVLAQLLRSHGWKRRDEIIISIVIFLLIIGLVLAGIGALPLQNKISTTLARLALEPDASQWSLGLLAGFLCANLNHWITPGSAAIKTAGEANLYKWRLIIFGGAIFILGGLALLAPYSSRLMERVTSLQAPYLKLQFADPSAERQLGLGTERDRYSTDLLVGFPSGGRTIQYDCGYEALKNGDGIASFRGTKRYGVIEKAVAFRNRLNPYIMRLISLTESESRRCSGV